MKDPEAERTLAAGIKGFLEALTFLAVMFAVCMLFACFGWWGASW